MNGVINTTTGDLLRAGYADFSQDGQFNASTETYRTDVPNDAVIKTPALVGNYNQWDGSGWIEVPQPQSDNAIVVRNPNTGSGVMIIGNNGNIKTPNRVAANTLGVVNGKLELFDIQGSSLGFLAIYDEIT